MAEKVSDADALGFLKWNINSTIDEVTKYLVKRGFLIEGRKLSNGILPINAVLPPIAEDPNKSFFLKIYPQEKQTMAELSMEAFLTDTDLAKSQHDTAVRNWLKYREIQSDGISKQDSTQLWEEAKIKWDSKYIADRLVKSYREHVDMRKKR